MSKHDDGGPAFPGGQFRTMQRVGEEPRDIPAGPQGMSLRDWFAGQALVALIAKDEGECWDWDLLATRAHKMADAMLAARKAKP